MEESELHVHLCFEFRTSRATKTNSVRLITVTCFLLDISNAHIGLYSIFLHVIFELQQCNKIPKEINIKYLNALWLNSMNS